MCWEGGIERWSSKQPQLITPQMTARVRYCTATRTNGCFAPLLAPNPPNTAPRFIASLLVVGIVITTQTHLSSSRVDLSCREEVSFIVVTVESPSLLDRLSLPFSIQKQQPNFAFERQVFGVVVDWFWNYTESHASHDDTPSFLLFRPSLSSFNILLANEN